MNVFCFSHHQRHSHTTQTPKENVCVCVLLLKRRLLLACVTLWGHQWPQGSSKTTCTNPPSKSVHVVLWPESACKSTTEDVTQHTTEVLHYRSPETFVTLTEGVLLDIHAFHSSVHSKWHTLPVEQSFGNRQRFWHTFWPCSVVSPSGRRLTFVDWSSGTGTMTGFTKPIVVVKRELSDETLRRHLITFIYHVNLKIISSK